MIGIFDSGLGGLTALKEIRAAYPEQDLVYFGDTGRVPYGPRSRDIIIQYARQDMRFLMTHKPDAVVVACGTVSSTALENLRAEFDLPIIGVVEGASKRALEITQNGRIGVIGTAATIRSGAYEKTIQTLAGELGMSQSVHVSTAACPLFVPLVENGFAIEGDPVSELVCERYLAPMREAGVDTLILGCTHYPLLAWAISKTLPGVNLVSSGAEAAKMLRGVLKEETIAGRKGNVRYYVSDDPAGFAANTAVFLAHNPEHPVEKIDIEKY